jgi:hypothetical protein
MEKGCEEFETGQGRGYGQLVVVARGYVGPSPRRRAALTAAPRLYCRDNKFLFPNGLLMHMLLSTRASSNFAPKPVAQ